MRNLFWMLYGCLFLSIVAGICVYLYHQPEIHFPWEAFPVFSALYGFVGCIAIILVSKAIGHYWLQKDEDYYEKHEKSRGED